MTNPAQAAPAHLCGYLAALHAADQRDPLTAGRVVAEGNDVCHVCDREIDENDLWHAGPDGDGEPTCARCVMSGDLYYNKLRVLAREAAAVLACSHQTTSARRLAAKIQNLLDGEMDGENH